MTESGRRRVLTVNEYRRGRNFIRVGDVVRVKSSKGRRDGFEARVRLIRKDKRTGEVAEVEVFGGRRGHAMVRTFVPERIERVAQTRKGRDRRTDR